MTVVILAGGFGTRISEESHTTPKPMIEVGGHPILWHIMKYYSSFGYNDFVICAGYKAYVIKEYFSNYFIHNSDVTYNLRDNSMVVHESSAEPWKVTVVDTGLETQTGGRLKRVKKYLTPGEDFHFTYGDGVSDVNLKALVDFHKDQKRQATVTSVMPPGRFGALDLEGNVVNRFLEKPKGDGSYINGGFFVLNYSVIDLIQGDSTIWEKEPMEQLALSGQLSAYKHHDFWLAMDTLRDKRSLEKMWNEQNAPWKRW